MTLLSSCGRYCAALAMLLFAVQCMAAHRVNFDHAGELEQGFQLRTIGGQDGGSYVWSPEAGAGGAAGRLNILPTSGAGIPVLFSTFAFDLNQSAVEASFLFQGGNTAGASIPRIGLLLHTQKEAFTLGSVPLATTWLQDGSGREPARLAASGTEDGGLEGLASGNWYGLQTRWSLAEGGTEILVTSELWDYGTSGSDPLNRIAQVTTRITDSSLFGNGSVVSPLYLGFFAQNGIGGAVTLDQLSFSGEIIGGFIPEPSTAALALGIAAILSSLYRRKLRQLHPVWKCPQDISKR